MAVDVPRNTNHFVNLAETYFCALEVRLISPRLSVRLSHSLDRFGGGTGPFPVSS